MFSDVHWNGSISCYRSPTQPNSTNAKWGFVWSICDICRVRRQSISSSHQNDTQGDGGLFLDEYYRFTLSFALYVRMKYHSRGGLDGKKYLLMLKNRRKTHLIERERGERGAVYKRQKKLYFKAVHVFYSRGSSHPCIIESSSVCPAAWYLTLHVFDSIILARVDTSRLLFFPLYPPFLDDFHVFLCGALQVSPQNFFLKQKEELSDSAREPSHLGGGAAEETLKWWQPSWKGR